MLFTRLFLVVLVGGVLGGCQAHPLAGGTRETSDGPDISRGRARMRVHYLIIASYENEAAAIPGQFEPISRTFYPWDGIVLVSKELPSWGAPQHGIDNPFLHHAVTVGEPVEPEIACMRVERDRDRVVQPGYWDWSNRAFYAWRDVWVTEAQWNQLVEQLPELARWRSVQSEEVVHMRGIFVPRYHAYWAITFARLSGSSREDGLRVSPEITLHAPMTVVQPSD